MAHYASTFYSTVFTRTNSTHQRVNRFHFVDETEAIKSIANSQPILNVYKIMEDEIPNKTNEQTLAHMHAIK